MAMSLSLEAYFVSALKKIFFYSATVTHYTVDIIMSIKFGDMP